jgi:hypothetical protein
MVERLSSLQTFASKFITPPVWCCGYGFVVLESMNAANLKTWPAMFLFWVVGTGFTYWSGVRLKKVSIDDQNLYVSNYLTEIAVPFSFIGDVTSHKWLNHNLATIHFKSATQFGDRIVFMPPYRFFPFAGAHPTVARLKHLAMGS